MFVAIQEANTSVFDLSEIKQVCYVLTECSCNTLLS